MEEQSEIDMECSLHVYHGWPLDYAVLERGWQLKHGMNTQFQVCVHAI